MKKTVLVLCVIIILTPCLFANRGMNVRFGFLTPSATKTGIFPGFSYGFNIDNIIDMGVGFDYFYRNERDYRDIVVTETETGTTVELVDIGSDLTTYYIPLMASIRVGIPVDLPIIPYGGAALGWGLLWEDVFIAGSELENGNDRDDVSYDSIDEVNFYNGFNWGLQLGAKYPLSPNASFYGEAFFNGGRMKKNIERGAEGITWDEINMSGAGLRLGIEVSL